MTDLPPEEPGESQPPSLPPFTPMTEEDGAYLLISGSYAGLRRTGTDPLGAALITAAYAVISGLAQAAQQPPGAS